MIDPNTLELRAEDVGLILRCERVDDRFRLRVTWIDDSGNEIALLQSIEGSPSDDFPPSPPIQQLHAQNIETTPVLLGVGMAGRGHWSVSMVSKTPSGQADLARTESNIEFQHALNLRGEAQRVGCTWMANDSIQWQQIPNPATGRAMLVAALDDQREFQIFSIDPVGCDLFLEFDENRTPKVSARPVESNLAIRPIRWEFGLSVAAVKK